MPLVAPALTLIEKLYTVHNITNLVPVKLDLDELNYSSWRYFFMIHCNNFNVSKHIEPKTDDASTSTPPTEEWLTVDSIIKSSIILTLSHSRQKWFIKINPTTARDAWERVEKLFQDNKRTRTVTLKGELRMLHMGDQSTDEYFSKINSLVTLLSDLRSDVSKDDVVTYAINGLSDKYGSLAQIIAHKDPFPDLATMLSMVSTEEMRLRSKSPIQQTNMNASAPQVLFAASNIPRGGDNLNTRNRNNRKPNTSIEEPADLNWNMDTGASSHLNSSTSNLSTIFNSCMYPSVLVGDEKSIHVTNTGHSTLRVSVTRDTSRMFLSQQKYATKVLERAGMLTCNLCRTPVDTDSKLSDDGDLVSDPTLYRSLVGAW
uniref:Hybrid signal transduction histidine kinase M n=1 Tax=Tanacetum cinerariifolium TaxID=118510 RepID=A0A6L2KEU3_TANCI|nr:hybrid signal transduction histidine kinase M [Tanacetum cinerariifolium]